MGTIVAAGRVANAVARSRMGQGGLRAVGNVLKRKFKNMKKPKSAKRQRIIQDSGGYNQWNTHRSRSGTGLKRLQRISKLINNNIAPIRFRFSKIKAFDDNGSVFVTHGPTAVAGVNQAPIKIFELTGAVQGATGFSAIGGFTPCYNTTTGEVTFQAQAGSSAAGVLSEFVQVEQQVRLTSNIGRRSLLDWTRCRLNVWGKTSRPSRVTVSIVQFNNEGCVPDINLPQPGQSRLDRNECWQEIMKPLISNPISSRIKTGRESVRKPFMRVLKSTTYIIDPTSTTENDADPHVKTIDMFHRWNRSLSYEGTSPNSTGTQLIEPDQYAVADEASNDEPSPRPTQRLYLMITSWTGASVATPSTANSVSIDWNIQMRHTVMDV